MVDPLTGNLGALDPSRATDPARAGKLLNDPHTLHVLRVAAREGYLLVGPHHRVVRRDPDRYGRPGSPGGVADIGRAEQDAVQRLAVAGLVDIDGTEAVIDGGEHRTGHPLRLTRTGAIALTSWSNR